MLRAMTIPKEFSQQIIGLFANSVARNAEFLFNSRNTTGDTGGPMYANAQSRPLVGFADHCLKDHRPSHFAAVLRPQHSLSTEDSALSISNRDPSGSPRGAAGDAQGRCRRRIGGAFPSTKKSQPHQTQPLSEISYVVSEIFRALAKNRPSSPRHPLHPFATFPTPSSPHPLCPLPAAYISHSALTTPCQQPTMDPN